MVTDVSGWEYTSPGHERTRSVYVESSTDSGDEHPISVKLSFTVRFDPRNGAVTDAYAMDDKGQKWGRGSLPPALTLEVSRAAGLVIKAPQFFADQAFMTWLNGDEPKFTWHQGDPTAGEYSDVVVCVDPSLNGAGTDTGMPEHIWDQIVHACKVHLGPCKTRTANHYTVRLTNLKT